MAIVNKEILSVSQYLCNTNLQIPHFQRPYKWKIKNVVQLIEDIERFKTKSTYRIGTIVIYKEGDKYKIVDGQQRTVTFLLMHKILKAKQLNIQESLKNQIDNINEFCATFSNDISKKNIKDNYREIERRLASVTEEFINFFYNKCEITYFVIDDISEAFQFFDSQNARGKDLEPHDLLKAFHLREINTAIVNPTQLEQIVDTWEEMETKKLVSLFSDFLFRVRGWCKGNSSRYFTKSEIPLFKGFTLDSIEEYPFVQIYKFTNDYVALNESKSFPFQLDQIIINGRNFFDLITHYNNEKIKFENFALSLEGTPKNILKIINEYDGKDRTGDKYVRMLFDCAMLYYIDKFGLRAIESAVEKIFIWAFSIRLTYQSLQMASVDNYVIQEFNIFKSIKEAIYKEEIINIELPLVKVNDKTGKIDKLVSLFTDLKYITNE
jgi:hypothetical protein